MALGSLWYKRCTTLSTEYPFLSREYLFWWSLRMVVYDLEEGQDPEEVFTSWVEYLDFKIKQATGPSS